jgi:hypothetical protein
MCKVGLFLDNKIWRLQRCKKRSHIAFVKYYIQASKWISRTEKAGVVVHSCNPDTQEVEAGGS